MSVIPYTDSTLLVSYRESDQMHFGLYEFDPAQQRLGTRITGAHLVDPVLITETERPRKLPSAVNPENPTGLILSQNIHQSDIPGNITAESGNMADRIRVSGLLSQFGDVPVEEDGSFYLKMEADIPFRFETLNEAGEVIRGPSDWIWVRPNERRGCVGCHADLERAPENIVSMAVKNPPVFFDTGIKELER